MKKLGVLLLAIMMLALDGYSQQEAQYTQFMFNKLPLNAGYTGGRDVLSLRALYRTQWVNIDGAPQTATFSIHNPLKNENLAIGGNFVHDWLGVSQQTTLNGNFAYRIKLSKKVKLSLGITAGMFRYSNNLSEIGDTRDPNFAPGDYAFQENVTRIFPNFGAGAYLYHEYFYVGVNSPNLIKGDLYGKDKAIPANVELPATRLPHLMAMAGGVVPMGRALKLRPPVLFKHVVAKDYSSPFSMDFNLSLMILDKVNVGATYRTTFNNVDNTDALTNRESVDFMLEIWPTKQLLIGYAYDLTLSELSNYTSGSHEVTLGFDFSFDKKKIVTPRYF